MTQHQSPIFKAILLSLALLNPSVALADGAGGTDAEILRFTDPSVLESARKGDKIAQFLIAGAFLNGKLTKQDIPKALYWAQRSADQGFPMAMVQIASLYEKGTGVNKAPEKAAQLYQKAADIGDPIAALRLAGMYFGGKGIPKDAEKAAGLMHMSAKQNIPAANHYYADMLWIGRGVQEDRKKAISFYLKAADLGWPYSARILAAHYFRGQEIPKDKLLASKWLQVSLYLLGKKDDVTVKTFQAIWPQLSETERREGIAQAEAYIKSHKDAISRAMNLL